MGSEIQIRSHNEKRYLPSIAIGTTSNINITVSPQNSTQNSLRNSVSSNHSQDQELGRSQSQVSVRSFGSSASGSRPPSRTASMLSQSGGYQNGFLNGRVHEVHEEDSAMNSDRVSERSFGSSNGIYIGSEISPKDAVEDGKSAQCCVSLYMDREVIVLIKVVCQAAQIMQHPTFQKLLFSITNESGSYLRQNPNQHDFTAVFVNKLKLQDGKVAKEHLSELSRAQDSGITISDVHFWRTLDETRHVGSYVDGVVKTEGRCTLCHSCTIVVLGKTSKYAVAEEFANKLCDQIAGAKPIKVGSKDKALEEQKLKAKRTQHVKVDTKELLSQTSWWDNTINIAEAARRSFVDVLDFKVFE